MQCWWGPAAFGLVDSKLLRTWRAQCTGTERLVWLPLGRQWLWTRHKQLKLDSVMSVHGTWSGDTVHHQNHKILNTNKILPVSAASQTGDTFGALNTSPWMTFQFMPMERKENRELKQRHQQSKIEENHITNSGSAKVKCHHSQSVLLRTSELQSFGPALDLVHGRGGGQHLANVLEHD